MSFNQLSFDILNPTNFSLEQTIAELNLDVKHIIENSDLWPSNTLLIYGENGCGANYLCKNSLLAKNQKYYCLDKEEEIILELLMHAELGEYKLILSYEGELNSLEFKSADLSSRIKNIYKVKMKEPTTEFLRMILKSNLLANGIKFSDQNIGIIISKLPKKFESVAKVQNYLIKNLDGNKKITKSMLEELINDFINTNLNGDLFNERSK